MRRGAVVLLLLAACAEKPEATAIQRGEALFAPCAQKLGSTIAGDLKKSNPAGFDQYLKEIGGKEEADLVRKIARETLKQYAEALSVSSAKESDLKAGRFDDDLAERKIKAAQERFALPKVGLPHLCKVLLEGRSTGQWKSGLDLEFASRVLYAEGLIISATRSPSEK